MNKRIFYLAAVAIGFLSLSSCEENEDNDPTYVIPNYLAGKWELKQTGSLNSRNILSYEDVAINENCEYDNLVFGADNSFSENDYEFGSTCELESLSGVYSLVDGNIIVNYTDVEEDLVLDVVSLNDTQLEIVYTDEANQLVFLKFTKA